MDSNFKKNILFHNYQKMIYSKPLIFALYSNNDSKTVWHVCDMRVYEMIN